MSYSSLRVLLAPTLSPVASARFGRRCGSHRARRCRRRAGRPSTVFYQNVQNCCPSRRRNVPETRNRRRARHHARVGIDTGARPRPAFRRSPSGSICSEVGSCTSNEHDMAESNSLAHDDTTMQGVRTDILKSSFEPARTHTCSVGRPTGASGHQRASLRATWILRGILSTDTAG